MLPLFTGTRACQGSASKQVLATFL